MGRFPLPSIATWPCPDHPPRTNLTSPTTSSTGPGASPVAAPPRSNSGSGPSWSCRSTPGPTSRTPRPGPPSDCTRIRSGPGGSGGRPGTSPSPTGRAAGGSPLFPPLDLAVIKAVACETVFHTGAPLSRQSVADVTARARAALGKPVSRSTVWRVLDADAIKPWRYEHWIFPRDPEFAVKAGRVLDLYAGLWGGERLGPGDRVLSADEKTSIQARARCHPTLGPAPGRPRRIEHEYDRGGALQYLAAWDIRAGLVLGRCEPTTGIDPFARLVSQAMGREPYRSAARVFWVVDNGSSHRGEAARQRLARSHPNAVLVHTPVHASWLNQVEIYFSLVQRKVLTPNDFTSLAEVEQRLRLYEALTNRRPRPFDWRFDRRKLAEFLGRLERHQPATTAPANP
jgi:DDE superfamily endonuclease